MIMICQTVLMWSDRLRLFHLQIQLKIKIINKSWSWSNVTLTMSKESENVKVKKLPSVAENIEESFYMDAEKEEKIM